MRVLISDSSSFFMSVKAVERARELGANWAVQEYMRIRENKDFGLDYGPTLPAEVPRHDPLLLKIFDELGGGAMCGCGDMIRAIEIPDDVNYFVGSYCCEWIAEQHREWFADTSDEGQPAKSDYYTFTKESVFHHWRDSE